MWSNHSSTLTEFDLIDDIRQAPAEVGKQAASQGAACLLLQNRVKGLTYFANPF